MFLRKGGTGCPYYFVAILVMASTNGNYTFQSDTKDDIFGYLYNKTFTPNNTNLNFLTQDDDAGPGYNFRFTATLLSAHSAIHVVTTYYPSKSASFKITIDGPSQVTFRPYNSTPLTVICPPTTTTTTSTTTTKDMVTGVQSSYADVLTSNSYSFSRKGRNDCPYYFVAIQMNTSTTGNYSFQSTGNTDIYGYLYNETFTPNNTGSNFITQDDDSVTFRPYNGTPHTVICPQTITTTTTTTTTTTSITPNTPTTTTTAITTETITTTATPTTTATTPKSTTTTTTKTTAKTTTKTTTTTTTKPTTKTTTTTTTKTTTTTTTKTTAKTTTTTTTKPTTKTTTTTTTKTTAKTTTTTTTKPTTKTTTTTTTKPTTKTTTTTTTKTTAKTRTTTTTKPRTKTTTTTKGTVGSETTIRCPTIDITTWLRVVRAIHVSLSTDIQKCGIQQHHFRCAAFQV
ncbi:unnamed protein product [Rotaria socialis]